MQLKKQESQSNVQLLNQIHVSKEHASAAVAAKVKRVKGITTQIVILDNKPTVTTKSPKRK